MGTRKQRTEEALRQKGLQKDKASKESGLLSQIVVDPPPGTCPPAKKRLAGDLCRVPCSILCIALRKVGVAQEEIEAAYNDADSLHQQNLLQLALPFVGVEDNAVAAGSTLRGMINAHAVTTRETYKSFVPIGTKAPAVLLEGVVSACEGNPHEAYLLYRKMLGWEKEMAPQIKQSAEETGLFHPDDDLPQIERRKLRWYPPTKTPPKLDDLVEPMGKGFQTGGRTKFPAIKSASPTQKSDKCWWGTRGNRHSKADDEADPPPARITREEAAARRGEEEKEDGFGDDHMARRMFKKNGEMQKVEVKKLSPQQMFGVIAQGRGSPQWQQLEALVRNNKYNEIEMALSEGLDPSLTDVVTGNTLLIVAVIHQQKRLSKLLIKSGANVNAKNLEGRCALHYAQAYEYGDMMGLLRKHGAHGQ